MGNSASSAGDEKSSNVDMNKITPTPHVTVTDETDSPRHVTSSAPHQTNGTLPKHKPNDYKSKTRQLKNGSRIDIPPSPIQHNRMSRRARESYQDSLENLRIQRNAIMDIRYKDYVYPFENLVFEGGGAKGQCYIGCLKVS